ncbi:hypothetical protein ACWCOV_00260 [Kribbella sp. NPDC002412]
MSVGVKSPTAEELRGELAAEARVVFSGNEWSLIGDQLGGGAVLPSDEVGSTPADE